ncbi:hypothetical protein SAMN04489727_0259 [Amycolatopsis tolypomycina]|uniref:Uncharacterized protein n=1 Tax=Amycolatopsis tolypomycina TaxID=208445 RepID=A0A1H4I842_9PSEU|nr:hypothetical protein [Amycolatopsis tolypomycina]SEB30075.1 hypothetical protein SAMN04489727_0259 [Amycolatopsis tolypomycina]
MCEACELEPDLPALPPVQLPSAAEALAAAERSPGLADLRRYVAELDGTSKPGRTLLPRWAEACGLVRVLKDTHVPMKKNAKLLKQPLELWARAFEALGEAGYGIAVEDDEVPFEFGMLFPDFLSGLQMTLYSAGGTPMPLELLYGLADEMPSLLTGLDVHGGSQWHHGLRVTLAVLDRFGAIERSEAGEEDLAKIAEAVGRPGPDPTLVRLTPLAFWALNRMLRAEGVDAPVIGELAAAPFETLADHLTEASPEVAEAELAAWLAHRSPADAATEAAGFLREAESPAQRLLALLALEATGAVGVAAARTVREEGGIAGAVTAAWLVERGEIAAGTLTADEMSLGMTDHLAAMDDFGVLFAELEALDDPLAVVGVIAAADHPDRLRLLDVIAQEHPDNKVAKQARKARFTLRRN